VELFQGSQPPAHVIGSSAEGERRSKRARKASAIGGGRITLRVNADTTVKDLKMTVWERMGVSSTHPLSSIFALSIWYHIGTSDPWKRISVSSTPLEIESFKLYVSSVNLAPYSDFRPMEADTCE
jgi:hypothetical protein